MKSSSLHFKAIAMLVFAGVLSGTVFAQVEKVQDVLYFDDFGRDASIFSMSGVGTPVDEGWKVTSGLAFLVDSGVGRTISEKHEGRLGSQSPYPFNLAYYASRASTRSFAVAGDSSTYGQAPQNTFRVIQEDWLLEGSYTVETRFQVTKIRWEPGISGGFGVSLLLNWNDAKNVNSLDNRSWYVVQLRFADVSHTVQVARRSHNAHQAGLPSDLNYFGLTPARYWDVPGFPGIVEGVWYTLRVIVEVEGDKLHLSVYCKEDGDESFAFLGKATDTGRLYQIHNAKVYYAGAPHTTGVFGIRSDYADVEFDFVKILK